MISNILRRIIATYNARAAVVSEIPQENTNYTIKKVVDSYQGKEYFTRDYIDFIVGIFHSSITQNKTDDFRVLIDTFIYIFKKIFNC